MISSRRSAADLRRIGAVTRRMLVTTYCASSALVAPDLDRDLLDRQRDRGLRLGGLDADALGTELGGEAVGDHRAQPLERLVRALLRDQRDHLADLAVVDRVLDAVGDQRVRLADVEAHVEHQALPDLSLGRRDAVMGVERQPDDLDGDPDLGALLVVIVVVQVVVVVLVGVGGHLANVAAAPARASAVAATSWTRNTRAPRSKAITLVATVACTRSVTSRPVRRPRKLLRLVPMTIGRPRGGSSSSRRRSSRLWSSGFPKPIPGSSWIRSSGTPALVAAARRSSRKALTSSTTSP